MTNDNLIWQIEAALQRLKAGIENAKAQLADLFGQLKLELCDISESTGVAVGQNIQ